MRLFIAEKPSVAKALAEELGVTSRGEGFIVCGSDTITWCFGHMLEQAEPDDYTPDDVPRGSNGKKIWRIDELPIVPEQWILNPKDDAKKQLQVIGRLLKESTEAVNAGDPDREGCLLVDEVLDHFRYEKPVRRFWASAVDSVALQRALKGMKDNSGFSGWSDAARGRARADWLIGMNLSRAYTLRAQRGGSRALLTVGRVQTPTLALIVQRDLDVENFKPIPFHTIRALVQHDGGSFLAAWKAQEEQEGLDPEGRLIDTAIADSIVSKVTGKSGQLVDYKQDAKKKHQPLAFALSDITVLASSRFGYNAATVLKVCQSLYETHKLTSYPRTDCAYLPESQLADAPEVMAAVAKVNPHLAGIISGVDFDIKSRTWNDKKVTAHHGIIPTMHRGNLASLDEQEKNIYSLIVHAYIAQFYPIHEFMQTTVVAEIENEIFSASGKVVTKNGWCDVFQEAEAEDDGKEQEGEQSLPVM